MNKTNNCESNFKILVLNSNRQVFVTIDILFKIVNHRSANHVSLPI